MNVFNLCFSTLCFSNGTPSSNLHFLAFKNKQTVWTRFGEFYLLWFKIWLLSVKCPWYHNTVGVLKNFFLLLKRWILFFTGVISLFLREIIRVTKIVIKTNVLLLPVFLTNIHISVIGEWKQVWYNMYSMYNMYVVPGLWSSTIRQFSWFSNTRFFHLNLHVASQRQGKCNSLSTLEPNRCFLNLTIS